MRKLTVYFFRGVSIPLLKHEAQYYGITPLVKRLQLCEEMNESACGDILYHGCLEPPKIPTNEGGKYLLQFSFPVLKKIFKNPQQEKK